MHLVAFIITAIARYLTFQRRNFLFGFNYINPVIITSLIWLMIQNRKCRQVFLSPVNSKRVLKSYLLQKCVFETNSTVFLKTGKFMEPSFFLFHARYRVSSIRKRNLSHRHKYQKDIQYYQIWWCKTSNNRPISKSIVLIIFDVYVHYIKTT